MNIVLSADTYIYKNNPTGNYSTEIDCWFGESIGAADAIYHSIILPSFSGIPVGSKLSSAVLRIVQYADQTLKETTLKLYRILRNVNFLQVTWNIYSNGNSWAVAGCGDSTNDYDGANEVGSATIPEDWSGEKLITLDTAIMQSLFDGAYPNYGLLLKTTLEDQDASSFYSIRGSNVTFRPRIAFTYREPTPFHLIRKNQRDRISTYPY